MKYVLTREKILEVYQKNQSKGFNIPELAEIIHRDEDIVADQLNKMVEQRILYINEGLRYLNPSYKD